MTTTGLICEVTGLGCVYNWAHLWGDWSWVWLQLGSSVRWLVLGVTTPGLICKVTGLGMTTTGLICEVTGLGVESLIPADSKSFIFQITYFATSAQWYVALPRQYIGFLFCYGVGSWCDYCCSSSMFVPFTGGTGLTLYHDWCAVWAWLGNLCRSFCKWCAAVSRHMSLCWFACLVGDLCRSWL